MIVPVLLDATASRRIGERAATGSLIVFQVLEPGASGNGAGHGWM
jgi:hypothetical protein